MSLMNTALSGADFLQTRSISNFLPVDIEIKPPLSSFNFLLTDGDKERLVAQGQTSTKTAIQRYKQLGVLSARPQVSAETEYIEKVLNLIARDLFPDLSHVRGHIMLPISITRRKVLYRTGLDSTDEDGDLDLGMESGLTGFCWKHKVPYVANMVDSLVKTRFEEVPAL